MVDVLKPPRTSDAGELSRFYEQLCSNVNNLTPYKVATNLANDIASIGTTETTLIIGNTQTLTSNLTCGSNVYLQFVGDGEVDPDGNTLTIYSPEHVISSTEKQIFPADESITFTSGGTVYPEWWGAVGDNSTDDSDAFNSAVVSATPSAVDSEDYFILKLRPGATYRIIPGEVGTIKCDIDGPASNIGAYDDTDDNLIEIEYNRSRGYFKLKTLIGYDHAHAESYLDTQAVAGTGLKITRAYYSWVNISRAIGFDEGILLDGNSGNTHIANNFIEVGEIRHNGTGFKLHAGTANIESNSFTLGYFYDNRVRAIDCTGGNGGNIQSNYFNIWALEPSEDNTTHHGIYLDGDDVRRNEFRVRHITDWWGGDSVDGKIILTKNNANDNLFRMACMDWDRVSQESGSESVFDMHTNNISEQQTGEANTGRSMIRGSAAPTVSRWREGDIVLNDSPSDGKIGWVCISTGAPGTWRSFGSAEYMYPVWAEENAAIAATTYEWAFGNGANTPSDGGMTVYVPSGWSCTVVAMSLRVGGGTATVELVYNGTPQGSSAQVVLSSGQSATDEFVTPLSISNNDYINFRTLTASGTSGPCVATAWLRMVKD